ncbi:PREDICTED: jacalin-related lectin 23-like [Amphimedon queenslandica]|uniref:Jacalin-type lectin domain-containing protein n=1 Tax=Amphimedon queenslandica TaxID=400682 RepID=A0A1X7TN71_AMPQE|nr:PREDICTED: jacalin-related lectin 23-like [Amphimedon queenslandica]|eukprot:XP_011407207.1 PREDICTED: jacalin-related lectin 23-like [Amphimedon queenslandica]
MKLKISVVLVILLIGLGLLAVYYKKSSKVRKLTKSVAYGGNGGTEFDDYLGLNNIYGIHSIIISFGDIIDSIEVCYAHNNIQRTVVHGKPSSNTQVGYIALNLQEEIIKIEGKIDGEMVGQLTITTIGPNSDVPKIYGPFGKKGTRSFTFEGQILAFHGRSGNSLDRLGVYRLEKLTKSDQYGSTSASPFDDISDLNNPPVVSLKSITVWSRPEMVQAIQAEYLLVDGSTLEGARHGANFATEIATIPLEDGDQIVSMDGKTNPSDKSIAELSFTVAKGNKETKTYGPYGKGKGEKGSKAFHVHGNILGIHGASGSHIEKIGAYYI